MSKETIKNKFKNGMIPDENDFGELIDYAGESDAEVIQARGNHTVLNERLKDVDKRLSEMPIKPLKYGPLEMPSDFKPDLLCTFYRDNDGIIKHNMDFQSRYKNGTKIYVRLNGNDTTGDGSPGKPFRTMTKAVEAAIGGSDSEYVIITNIPVFNRDEFIFNQTVTNKTISFVSENSYEQSSKVESIVGLTSSDYDSEWSSANSYATTTTQGASFTKIVTGSDIYMKLRFFVNGGIIQVIVDGDYSTAIELSTHNSTSETREVLMFRGLGAGNHELTVTYLGADPEIDYGGTPALNIFELGTFIGTYEDLSIAYKWSKDKSLVTSNAEYIWTEEGAGTYKTSRSSIRNVTDLMNIDIYGVPIPLVNASSLSDCQSTENTWYSEGSSVWVHRKDGLKPSSDNTVLNIGVAGINPKLGEGGVVYFENFIFTNWVTAHPFTATNTASTPQGEVCLNDVLLVGGINSSSRGNALSIEGIKDVYSFNVISAYAQLDGFNYHYTNISENYRRDCLAVEYNCKAYNLGLEFQGAGSNNASTSHEGASILRVGTVGYRNTGATIIDVNGCYSVLYDCNASQPMFDGIKGNGRAYSFTTEDSGREGKTYLINCGATEADRSLVIDTTHKAYIQNFKYDGEIVASGEIELL